MDSYLIGLDGMLSQSQDSRNADREMVASNVVDLSILNKLPDFRRLEVLKLVMIGSSKLSNHRTVVTSDHNGTATGGVVWLNTVFGANTTLALASLTELVCGSILSNTADVDGRLRRKDVLFVCN